MFCGKPIIAYSIQAAQQSGCFDHIVVSTDDTEIAHIALEYGAEVPFIRPSSLADDTAPVGVAVEHTLAFAQQEWGHIDYSCLLLATAPFVTAETLQKSLELLKKHPEKATCFSVTEYPFPIQRAIKIDADQNVSMFQPEHFWSRSQELEKAYHDAGQFSWNRTTKKQNPDEIPWGPSALPYILPSFEVQDIDTPEDWKRAEAMYRVLQTMAGKEKT